MIKKYFTALLPASNLEMEIKRLQRKSTLYIPFPPMIPLEFYDSSVERESFGKNIDTIEEFNVGSLVKKENWWAFEIPASPLNSLFNTPESELLPTGDFLLMFGIGENRPEFTELNSCVIRNWELTFFELLIWDEDNPFDNIELKEIWKIRKKKLRTTKPQL